MEAEKQNNRGDDYNRSNKASDGYAGEKQSADVIREQCKRMILCTGLFEREKKKPKSQTNERLAQTKNICNWKQ